MDWDAIGAIGEVLGSVGVLLTLVYLARQIHAANKLATASTTTSVMSAYSQLNETIIANGDVAELLARAKAASVEFAPGETVRLELLCNRFLNIWLTAETAFSNGQIDDQTFQIVLDDIRNTVTHFPGLIPLFKDVMKRFPASASTHLSKELLATIDKFENTEEN